MKAQVVEPETNTLTAYQAWAETYDSMPNPTRDADAEVMRALANRFANLDVLEFGCGTGKNTAVLALAGATTVLGLDISEAMLTKARLRDLPPSVAFVCIRSGAEWPTANRSIDVVTASLVLEHVERLSVVFQEAARVLRVGGRLWTSELHPVRQWTGSKAKFQDDTTGQIRSPDCFLHSFSDYVRAAREAGFTLEEVEEPPESGRPRLLVMGFQLGVARAL
jgi:ubiquinone/menaquinone biosynthesis C-methylase UbiE